jgi:hypothetical protein
MDQLDYRKYYDAERYLLEEVGRRFRDTGELEPADFYTMLIWKAERAKNRHKLRLTAKAGSFEKAVYEISSQLHNSSSAKARLQILMSNWGFLLPTASAVLTILYPKEFTVYDWRVCDEVGVDYKAWCSRPFSDELWSYYESFKRAVIVEAPSKLSLRDKDRFLIGRSTRKSIEKDWQRTDTEDKGLTTGAE